MGARVGRQLLQAVATLLLASLVVFWLARQTGSPLELLMPLSASQDDLDRARTSLGLDQPWHVQYGIYLANLARGDLGTSVRTGKPVAELIGDRLPSSLLLAGTSVLLSVLVAVPLGVAAAVYWGSPVDTLVRGFALVGQAVPSFWLALVLVLVFSVNLRFLPTSGTGGPQHLVLPSLTLACLISAGVVRIVRSAMLEALASEFVRVARAKGLHEWQVVWRHAFRNAMLPAVTFLGLSFGLIIAAAVAVETVFAWPGLGRLAYDAVLWRDYPLIQGVVLVWVGLLVLINLAVDALYAVLDPRVRAG